MSNELAIDVVKHKNPAMYMCCFGRNDLLDQARLLIESTSLFSETEFTYVIFTDLEPKLVAAKLSISDACVIVVETQAFGTISRYYARYRVTQHDALRVYQPIIYCDLDVICNYSLKKVVDVVLSSDKIFANLEEHGTAWTVGWFISDFPYRDRYLVREDVQALNSGIYAYSNHEIMRPVSRAVNAIETNVTSFHGDTYLALDQGVLNYCLMKTVNYDGDTLRQMIVNRPVECFSDIPRVGLIHFCGDNTTKHASKTHRMQAYFEYCVSQIS
ncbi:MAG: hypothetical protein INR71_01010 [Terriglobus roseus]|nr:hypothetical protein [Terriglobus roseus]